MIRTFSRSGKAAVDELTESQERCLLRIASFIERYGYAPTRGELRDMLRQRSTNGVNQILEQLQKKGYIRLEPARKKRNIKILRMPQRQLALFAEGKKAGEERK